MACIMTPARPSPCRLRSILGINVVSVGVLADRQAADHALDRGLDDARWKPALDQPVTPLSVVTRT